MNCEKHGAVPAPAKSSALTLKITGFICSKRNVRWVPLRYLLIDSEILNQEAVRNIVGNEMQLNRLPLLDCDFRRLKLKRLAWISIVCPSWAHNLEGSCARVPMTSSTANLDIFVMRIYFLRLLIDLRYRSTSTFKLKAAKPKAPCT